MFILLRMHDIWNIYNNKEHKNIIKHIYNIHNKTYIIKIRNNMQIKQGVKDGNVLPFAVQYEQI